MADRIVLVSDDSNFFDYIRLKLELRKSDELFIYSFDAIPEKLHLLENSLVIVNSENAHDKTIDLLKIFKDTPLIVMAYNEDEAFKKKCYRHGAFDFMTLLVSDSEFRARIIPALGVVSILNKNKMYRDLLVQNKTVVQQNEVFIDYISIIDSELKKIKSNSEKVVFAAISPDEKTKFLLSSNLIETIILNNLRRNDILMNYAPNKYFLFMFNIDLKSAEKLWQKIKSNFPHNIYAGMTLVTNQGRQQLINDALNKLHEAIAYSKDIADEKVNKNVSLNLITKNEPSQMNYKLYRQQVGQKLEQVITPVFYSVQQKYSDKLMGMVIEQSFSEGNGLFCINGRHFASSFKITSPGFAKINIDVSIQKGVDMADTKRISLELDEFESGLLSDLLEQYVLEIKNNFKE